MKIKKYLSGKLSPMFAYGIKAKFLAYFYTYINS